MAKSTKLKPSSKVTKMTFFTRFGTDKEQEFLLENFALLFSSGLDVVYCLEAVQSGMRTSQMKKLVADLIFQVKEGIPLWQSFENTQLLDASTISLMKIGESSGKLPENLKIIVQKQEKDRMFKSRLRSAMMYPILVLTVMLFVGIGISWFILPNLANVFLSMDLELPLLTRILLAFGQLLQDKGVVVVPIGLAVLGFILYMIFVNRKTKIIGQYILIFIPVISTLIKEVELTRFGFILSTLVGSGIPYVFALESLADSASIIFFKRIYTKLAEGIEEGKSFDQVFKENNWMRKFMPTHVQLMIVAAEKSGKLQPILESIAHTYQEKVDMTTKNLSTLMEPVLLTIVWVGVIILAIGVIGPIYDLVGNFNSISGSGPTTETASVTTGPFQPFNVRLNSTNEAWVRINSQPDINSKSVTDLKPNTILEVISKTSKWYQVKLSDGRVGWVLQENTTIQ